MHWLCVQECSLSIQSALSFTAAFREISSTAALMKLLLAVSSNTWKPQRCRRLCPLTDEIPASARVQQALDASSYQPIDEKLRLHTQTGPQDYSVWNSKQIRLSKEKSERISTPHKILVRMEFFIYHYCYVVEKIIDGLVTGLESVSLQDRGRSLECLGLKEACSDVFVKICGWTPYILQPRPPPCILVKYIKYTKYTLSCQWCQILRYRSGVGGFTPK